MPSEQLVWERKRRTTVLRICRTLDRNFEWSSSRARSQPPFRDLIVEQFLAVMSSELKAVVVGGTGAVGREVVGQLLESSKWGQVVTVGRRAVQVPAQPSGWDTSKLKQVIVDMDKLEEEAAEAFEGADSVFCALDTTRAVAGSAEGFRKVDLHYVEATAKAAKAAGVPHFSLVSAAGANAGLWANDLKPFHGLLYARTKGQAEEAVKSQGFPYTTIMRPGLLDRGDMARGMERAVSKLMSSVPVAQVAKTMVGDAEAFHTTGGPGGKKDAEGALKLRVWIMKEIQQYKE